MNKIDSVLTRRDLTVLARVAVSALIAIVSAAAGAPPAVRLILCILGFLLSGFELIAAVVKDAGKMRFFTEHLLMLLAGILAFLAGKYAEAVLGAILYCLSRLFADKLTVQANRTAEQAEISLNTGKKAGFTAFAEHNMRLYVPSAVAVALLIAAIPQLFKAELLPWLVRADVFLLAACPCAVLLPSAVCYLRTAGAAAEGGVLLPSEACVEKLGAVHTVVLDKAHVFSPACVVTQVLPVKGLSEENLLMLAAFAETGSDDAVAKAVLTAYGQQVDEESITAHEALPGLGVLTHAKGMVITAGNLDMMERLLLREKAEAHAADPGAIHVAVNSTYAGCIRLMRTLDGGARLTKAVAEAGVERIVLFSAEDEEITAHDARELGVDEYFANCDLDAKKLRLEKLLVETFPEETLLYVGAETELLSQADVGLSMRASLPGSDGAVLSGEPAALANAILAARSARAIIRQGITAAVCLKLILLVLCILGFAPFWAAVLADCGVTLLVLANTLRTTRRI